MEVTSSTRKRIEQTLTVKLSTSNLNEIVLSHIRSDARPDISDLALMGSEPVIQYFIDDFNTVEGVEVKFTSVEDSEDEDNQAG